MKKFFAVLLFGLLFLTGCVNLDANDQLLVDTLENDGWTCKRASCIFEDDDYSYKYDLVDKTYEYSFYRSEVVHGFVEKTQFKVNIDFVELTGDGSMSVYIDSFGNNVEATYDFSSNSTTCTIGEDILCNGLISTMESSYTQMTDYFADSGYIVED